MKIQTSRRFIARLAARRFARLLAASGAGVLSALAILAATPNALADVTKADNTTALNVGTSYTPAGVPTALDRIIFDNTIVTAANNAAALGGDLSILGIAFGTTSALTGNGYTINNTPGATLTLGTSGIALTSTVNNLTLNSVIKLGGSQIWDVVTGRTLTAQNAQIDLGANVLTVQGAGSTIISSLIYGTGGSITKAGTGTLTLSGLTGGSNTANGGNLFSGGITVGTGGTVTISGAGQSGTGLITSSGTLNITATQLLLTGGITVNAGTTTLSAANSVAGGTVTLTGGTLTLSNQTAAQLASVVLNSGTLTTPGVALNLGSLSGTQGFTQGAFALTLGTNNTSGTYSGNIAGAVGSNLTKQGSGTQVLNGTNATTGSITANGSGGILEIGGQFGGSGAVQVSAGTLRLNFGTNNTVTTDLLKSAALTVGGGNLSVVGRTDGTNAIQNFTGLTTNIGSASNIIVANGTGGGTTAVNLGGLTRNAGSSVNFTLPSGTQSATNGIQATSGTAGLLVPTNGTAYATVGGADFAAKDATNTFIIPLASAINATSTSLGAATDNSNITGVDPTIAASATINTIRFNDTAARTLTVGGTGQTLTVSAGGILVSNSVTGSGSRITGGNLVAASGTDVIVHQFSSQPFTLDTVVTGGILTKTGTGTLIVTRANTNTGNTYVASGRLQIGTNGTTTGSFAGSIINLAPNDPTAVLDVNNLSTTANYVAGGGGTGGYISLGNSGTLNINSVGSQTATYSGALVGGLGSVINRTATAGNLAATQGFQGSNQAFYGTFNLNTGTIGVFGGGFINATFNNNGGTFTQGGAGTTVQLGNLGGTGGTLIAGTNVSANGTYNIGYLGGASSYGGVVANGTGATGTGSPGTPGLTSLGKYGSGTTTLYGNNTYTGATQINSGGLIFDYSTGSTTPLATGSALTVGGGTATFRGLAAGGTTATTGTFGFNNGVLSRVVLDNNTAASGITVNLKTATINGVAVLGSSTTSNNILFDTSSSANNVLRTDVAIGAAGFTAADTVAIRTNNGILTTGATSTTGYRANVLIKDSTGVGFATTSGTSIVRYTGATALTAADTTTVLSETGTGNYILSTNLTRGASNQFLYNTIQLDSSSQAVTLTTDSNGNRFGGGGGSTTSGRGVLATGTNGATITSPGGTNQATYFNNYQTGGTFAAPAGQTLTLNMNLQGVSFFNGTGLTIATAAVNSNDQYFQSGVTRLTGAQASGDALTAGNGVYRLVGGVLEIGAHLTGITSSTSTADFSRSVGAGNGQVQLLGDTGFSAFGSDRTVNLGGAGQTLVWGNDNFLASPAGTTTEGNNTFRLSSVYSDSRIDFQNGIALGNITRNVDVANGSAAVDARLSGVISGIFAPTVTLANGNPAVLNAAAGLNKLGAGTLELTAANTYTGRTTVSAGTLLVNNTTGSGTGTGAVVVNSGGTLGGTGAMLGLTTVNSGGTITGGSIGSVGTLTLQNNLAFVGTGGGPANFATYSVDIGAGTNNSDRLAITGTLDLSTVYDQITFSGTPDGTSSYVLATFGSVSGVFDNGTAPAGYTFSYTLTELDLVPVPEPSTCVIGGLLVAVAVWNQRKRVGSLLRIA